MKKSNHCTAILRSNNSFLCEGHNRNCRYWKDNGSGWCEYLNDCVHQKYCTCPKAIKDATKKAKTAENKKYITKLKKYEETIKQMQKQIDELTQRLADEWGQND